jgi:hypothetical protein
MKVVLLIFLLPIVNTNCTEEIPTAGALLRVADNISADGAVKHVACKVRKEFFVISVLDHFVDFESKLIII